MAIHFRQRRGELDGERHRFDRSGVDQPCGFRIGSHADQAGASADRAASAHDRRSAPSERSGDDADMAVRSLVRTGQARRDVRTDVGRRCERERHAFVFNRGPGNRNLGDDHFAARHRRRLEDMANLRRGKGDGDRGLDMRIERLRR